MTHAGRRPAGAAMLVAAGLLATAATAEARSLDHARKLLLGGKYAAAEEAFKSLARSKGGPAWLGVGRVQLETGRYAEAAKSALKAARGKNRAKTGVAALTLLGEVQRARGDSKAAIGTFNQAISAGRHRKPKPYRAMILLGLTYHQTGQRGLAKAIFDSFYDDYGDGTIAKSNAEHLTYVAMACRYTDNFRDASDVFADATKADATQVEAFVRWAEVSLEKYEAGYAEKHYQRALAVNPHHARALVGLAQVVLEQSNDVRAAEKLLRKALKTNPSSVIARVVQAQMLIDNEEYLKGEGLLKQALKRDPRHLAALTMLATSHYLRDDAAGFARLKKKVLGINPKHSRFFHTVVKLAVRHHRYAESIKLGLEALKIDPQDPYALADLGTNHLRIGDDQTGLKYLQRAWQGDKYNVRNYNLLNLFEQDVAKHYEFVRTKHFRLRVHKSEKALITRIVAPLLERAYGTYQRKYRFTPKLPIVVEFFQDPQHYAVRTVGLPGLSALGVCFGPVITTTSPLAGRFNWGQVLWHELNHVFTIQLSRSRVPRWLTEGLADMEPALVRKEWKRENDFDIYKALRSGRLHGLASMNSAFTRARSLHDMVVAYYQGSLMAIHLVKHWGLSKVIAGLRRYGRGEGTDKVLPSITGLSLAALDKRFRAAELKRLAHYNRNWYADLAAYGDLAARRKQADAKPNDGPLQAAYAAALYVAGKKRAAAAAVERALKAAPRERLALMIGAQLALAKRDRGLAKGRLAALVSAGGDGYAARLALGQLPLLNKDLKTAVKHLAAAKRFDPEQGRPYQMLYRAYLKAGKTDRAISELKRLAWLQQQSFGPIAKLVTMLHQRQDHAGVRKYGQMAYYIAPGSVTLHGHLADAYLAKAPRVDLKRAAWHLDTALMTKPADKSVVAGLHVKYAKLHLLRRDKRQARSHYQKARKADPDLPELRQLKQKL